MTSLRLGLVVTTLLLTSACSSLSVKIPGPLIESPELLGEQGKVEFGGGIDDAVEHKFVEDASRRPPTLNEPTLERRQYYFYGRGGYQLQDWLEIGARYMPGGGTGGFGLLGGVAGTIRGQLIGVGAKTPGWKVAVYGGAFFTHVAIGGDQNGTFGNAGHNWSANASAFTTTAGTSIGYRFPDQNLLIFAAAAYANQAAEGKIEHKLSDNGLSPAASYEMKIAGNARTLALGVRMGDTVVWGLDARLLDRTWPDLASPDTRGGGSHRETMVLASVAFAGK